MRDLARRGLLLAMLVSCACAISGCDRREAAPQVAYTLLDGTRGTTAALRGKVLLVNFWSTSCAPCIAEMPKFAALQRQYRSRGLETLAVAMPYDAPALVADFAESRHLPFGVVIDNTGTIGQAFGPVEATPTTVLIDRHGAIVTRTLGSPDFAALQALVEKLLAEA